MNTDERTQIEKYSVFFFVLYGIGFIVSNVAPGRARIAPFDLVSGEYIAAATHYAFFTITPIVIGYHVGQIGIASRPAPGFKSWRVRKPFFWGLMGTGSLAAIFLVVSADQAPPTVITYIAYMMMLFGMTLVKQADVITYKWDDEPDETARSLYGGFLAILLLVLGTTMLFGLRIYPNISPRYGGGAGWLATVEMVDSASLADSVIVFDRDEGWYSVGSCTFVDGRAVFAPIDFPVDRVRKVRFERPQALETYLTNLEQQGCRS